MKLFAIGAFALASLTSGAAAAQTPAASTPVTHGAPIAGVCIYSAQRVLGQSTAGQSLQTGLQRLAQEVQGELAPYATSIQTEAQQLQQGGQAADPDGSRRRAFQQRLDEAQQLEQTRQNELRYTELMQTQAIGQATSPIITALYQQRGCSLLLDRGSVFLANPAMDITDAVIQQLNTTLPSLSFSRMAVPAQAQQPQQ